MTRRTPTSALHARPEGAPTPPVPPASTCCPNTTSSATGQQPSFISERAQLCRRGRALFESSDVRGLSAAECPRRPRYLRAPSGLPARSRRLQRARVGSEPPSCISILKMMRVLCPSPPLPHVLSATLHWRALEQGQVTVGPRASRDRPL